MGGHGPGGADDDLRYGLLFDAAGGFAFLRGNWGGDMNPPSRAPALTIHFNHIPGSTPRSSACLARNRLAAIGQRAGCGEDRIRLAVRRRCLPGQQIFFWIFSKIRKDSPSDIV